MARRWALRLRYATFAQASMSMSSYRLGGDDADRRLDRLLRKLFPEVPLSGLYRAIRTGAVTVNHSRAAPGLRTRQGDLLVVNLPAAARRREPPRSAPGTTVDLPLPVVIEAADVLVVNKPAGLAMSSGDDSVVARLRHHLPGSPSLTYHPSPVHQLDRMTSGTLLVAKTLHGARDWSRRFATRKVDKRYLVLVEGKCAAGRWDDPMRFDSRRGIATRSNDDGLGGTDATDRDASLRCAPLAYTPEDGGAPGLTLLLIQLETGRRHQIRAQAAWRGHPVSGDTRYGSRARRGRTPLLHAWQLSCRELVLSATAAPTDRQLRDLKRTFCDTRRILCDAIDHRL